jgi:hypothetical protein
MCYAALGNHIYDEHWLFHLLGKLLVGSKNVLRLLKKNPFESKLLN